jgi:hypothetical protein
MVLTRAETLRTGNGYCGIANFFANERATKLFNGRQRQAGIGPVVSNPTLSTSTLRPVGVPTIGPNGYNPTPAQRFYQVETVKEYVLRSNPGYAYTDGLAAVTAGRDRNTNNVTSATYQKPSDRSRPSRNPITGAVGVDQKHGSYIRYLRPRISGAMAEGPIGLQPPRPLGQCFVVDNKFAKMNAFRYRIPCEGGSVNNCLSQQSRG